MEAGVRGLREFTHMMDYRKILIAVINNFLACEGVDHTNYPHLTPLDGLTIPEQGALLECQHEIEERDAHLSQNTPAR
jgi:hypothetical protein